MTVKIIKIIELQDEKNMQVSQKVTKRENLILYTGYTSPDAGYSNRTNRRKNGTDTQCGLSENQSFKRKNKKIENERKKIGDFTG